MELLEKKQNLEDMLKERRSAEVEEGRDRYSCCWGWCQFRNVHRHEQQEAQKRPSVVSYWAPASALHFA